MDRPQPLTTAQITALLADGHIFRTIRTVHATRLQQPWGDAAVGGWLLNEQGVEWAVSAEVFEGTYTRVGPSTFTKDAIVTAVQVHGTFAVTAVSGVEHGVSGSWLVRNEVGEVWIERDAVFRADYERQFPTVLHRWARQTLDRGVWTTAAQFLSRQHRYGFLRGRFVLYFVLAVLFAIVGGLGWKYFGVYNVDSECARAAVQLTNEQLTAGSVHCSDAIVQRLWATISLFAGAYVSLSPQWDPIPPPELAVIGPLAFGLTLATAGSLLLWSRRVTDFLILRYYRFVRKPRLIVVGNGHSAAAIIRSCVLQGIRVVLVTDARDSVAAHATTSTIPMVSSGQLETALKPRIVRALIRRVGHTVVATDDDGANMRLQGHVRRIRGRQEAAAPVPPKHVRDPSWPINDQREPRDLVLIHDPDYAAAAQPLTIRDALPDREVTCPANNVAEQVLHVLIAVATRPGDSGRTIEVEIVECAGPDGDNAARQLHVVSTLRRWITSLDAALAILRRDSDKIPTLVLVPSGQTDGNSVRLYVGKSAGAVATRVLVDRPNGLPRIAITNADLVEAAADMRAAHDGKVVVRTARRWLGEGGDSADAIVVIDPDVVGFDAALVTDDVGTQWARMFDLTYNMMFYSGEWTVTGWLPGAPMADEAAAVESKARRKVDRVQKLVARQRAILAGSGPAESGGNAAGETPDTELHPIEVNRPADPVDRAGYNVVKEISNRYSSEAAVHHMLYLLGETGYELRKGDNEAGVPVQPDIGPAIVEYIARAEHHHWLRRTWTRPRRLSRRGKPQSIAGFSGAGANFYCFDGLVQLGTVDVSKFRGGEHDSLRTAADYNLRIPTIAYPAIAAAWGYRIVPQAGVEQVVPPWRTNDLEPCGREAVVGCHRLGTVHTFSADDR